MRRDLRTVCLRTGDVSFSFCLPNFPDFLFKGETITDFFFPLATGLPTDFEAAGGNDVSSSRFRFLVVAGIVSKLKFDSQQQINISCNAENSKFRNIPSRMFTSDIAPRWAPFCYERGLPRLAGNYG